MGALQGEAVALLRGAEAGRFQAPLSLVAGLSSGLSGLEVAYQHYRGSYSRRIMWTPILMSQALLAAGIWGSRSRWAARTVLPVVSAITLADCATGFVMHVRGIHRKPGGWRIPATNVALGPPPLAPLLFGMSAYMGIVAARMQPVPATGEHHKPDARRPQFHSHMALITGLSAICSGVEALYSHYKNNFQFKAQWTPILLAPCLAAAAFASAATPRTPRALLPVASALAMADGACGVFYHARGVARRPGGTHQLAYNLMYGPPILAPLLFASCGFLGLLASFMRPPKKGRK